MNVRYFYEFKGLDNILNRIEILSDTSYSQEEIEPSSSPFSIKYNDSGKLTPILSSGATLGFVSKEIFQFVGLHTDDMQSHMVKMYRGSELYWIGWLDPELYNEQLTDYTPYVVEFTASDFNILDRIKYRDSNGDRYNDIVSIFDHLCRCLKLLNLPFGKLYIGCTTTTVSQGSGRLPENAFLGSYVMSSNFYDEDGEPMTCREVIESLITPFGLSMVQKSGNVYIVDYNTIQDGISMRRYNFSTFSYEGDESVDFDFGNIKGKLYNSGDSYGFDTMYNNVTITSSLYGETNNINNEVNEDNVSDEISSDNTGVYIKTLYSKCEGWNHNRFLFYSDINTGNTIIGALINYTGNGTERNRIVFENKDSFLFPSDNGSIRLKCSAYINTKENPFDSEDKEYPETTRRMRLFCKLLLIQNGNVVAYSKDRRWYDSYSEDSSEYCELTFISSSGREGAKESRVVNQWITNSDSRDTLSEVDSYVPTDKNLQNGVLISLPNKSGSLRLIIDYAYIDDNKNEGLEGDGTPTIFKDVKDFLINNVSITIEDADGNQLSTDDYEFKSYINKKVSSDYPDITLKCISANEDKMPIGKANILAKTSDNGYEILTSFNRGGQTDILERLLMCTIHSNFSSKNEKFGCVVKMSDNPILGYIQYSPTLSGSYLVTGCNLDFKKAQTTMSCVGYSKDTAVLSSIPYE